MTVIGIDPGLSGAIAAFRDDGTLDIFDMPTLQGKGGKRQVNEVELRQYIMEAGRIRAAYIEDVHAMPRQGVTSSFNFGYGLGVIVGVVGALQIPRNMVTPQKWKRDMQVTADKDSSRARAMQLFPAQADLFLRKKDDGRAEAALIALWGMRQ